jgi:hypothetical protein
MAGPEPAIQEWPRRPDSPVEPTSVRFSGLGRQPCLRQPIPHVIPRLDRGIHHKGDGRLWWRRRGAPLCRAGHASAGVRQLIPRSSRGMTGGSVCAGNGHMIGFGVRIGQRRVEPGHDEERRSRAAVRQASHGGKWLSTGRFMTAFRLQGNLTDFGN